MKNKWLIAGGLIVVLVMLCGASLAVVGIQLMRSNGVSMRILGSDRFSAEGDQQWSFTADGPAVLALDSNAGNVTVAGGEGAEIKISAHKTTWDSSQARADSALAEMPIEVKQQGNKIVVRYLPPAAVQVMGSSRLNTVDFTITVPVSASINASVNSGNITLSSVVGKSDLHSQFGNVTATDVQGGLRATTNSGDIDIQRLQAGQEAVQLKTEFGDLSLEQGSAGDIDAHTNSGKLSLKNVQASGKASLGSQFGDMRFTDGSAKELAVEGNSGKITLSAIVLDGELAAHSQFGDINIEQVTASSYDLDANSGGISLQGAQGKIKAVTQFGRIMITDARNAILDLKVNSGGIDFSGSLGDGPQTLNSEFGDIHLALPKDTALSLDLKTGFGKVKCAFQFTLNGELDEKHWVGSINGGGASLTAQTNSGNITLEILAEK